MDLPNELLNQLKTRLNQHFSGLAKQSSHTSLNVEQENGLCQLIRELQLREELIVQDDNIPVKQLLATHLSASSPSSKSKSNDLSPMLSLIPEQILGRHYVSLLKALFDLLHKTKQESQLISKGSEDGSSAQERARRTVEDDQNKKSESKLWTEIEEEAKDHSGATYHISNREQFRSCMQTWVEKQQQLSDRVRQEQQEQQQKSIKDETQADQPPEKVLLVNEEEDDGDEEAKIKELKKSLLESELKTEEATAGQDAQSIEASQNLWKFRALEQDKAIAIQASSDLSAGELQSGEADEPAEEETMEMETKTVKEKNQKPTTVVAMSSSYIDEPQQLSAVHTNRNIEQQQQPQHLSSSGGGLRSVMVYDFANLEDPLGEVQFEVAFSTVAGLLETIRADFADVFEERDADAFTLKQLRKGLASELVQQRMPPIRAAQMAKRAADFFVTENDVIVLEFVKKK